MRGVLAPTGDYAGELWIAGEFEHVQGIRAGGVARYRGTCYEPVGVPPAQAEGLVQFEGDICVYGAFTEIDGRPVTGIARWDGAQWVALGAGVDGAVHAACEFAGELVCVGEFIGAGGIPAARVAAWNGTAWRAWPQGLLDVAFPRLRDVNGALTISGTSLKTVNIQSASILQWNGDAWVQVGGAINHVQDIAAFQGALVATSWFGPLPGAPAGVVRWTGTSWEALGTTVQNADALTIFEGKLLATGITGSWGSALWDGVQWTRFSPVMANLSFIRPAAYRGGLTVNGFVIMRSSGENESLGFSQDMRVSLYSAGEELVAIGAARVGAHGRGPSRFWRMASGAWRDVGPAPANAVFGTLHKAGNDVYFMAEDFASRVGNGEQFFMRWDGAGWVTVAAVQPVPGRSRVAVSAVEQIGSDLIVGGSFASIDGVAADGIARRVGGTWQPIGAGGQGWVGSIAEFDGQLVLGLRHESVPTPGSVLVLVWDGAQFVPLGDGLPVSQYPASIRDLREFNGDLYAAGEFITNDGNAIESLARWDGQSWSRVGSGVGGIARGLRPFIDELDEYEGQLLVGGTLKVFDLLGQPGTGLWDGSSWAPLPAGLEGPTTTARSIGRDLYVNGSLTFVEEVPISGLARFGPTPPPHPADLSASTDPAEPSYGVPDGMVDATDFFFFLERFQQLDYPICDIAGDSDPSSPCYGVPDGIIDISDFFAYLDRFVN